jgi:WD40 repeat protein
MPDYHSSQSGSLLATGGSAGILRVWSFRDSNPPELHMLTESRREGHSRAITSIAFSHDDKEIVSVGEDGGIFVWCIYQ